jgi:hypothetical protein
MSHPLPLENHLLSAIRNGSTGDETFNSLAMRVFQHQFQHNTPYQNYCRALGKSPDNINHWHDIPAVPTDVFKLHDTPILSFPPEKSRHTFITSGTTSEVKGQHHFPSLTLYEQSIINAWKQRDLPRPSHAIFLTATPGQAPMSSLSHMMGVLSHTFGKISTWAIDADNTIDLSAIHKAAAQHSTRNEPVALLGTALAFLHLFEQLDTPLTLPRGSWAMETGGYKGTRRHMEKSDLYSLFKEKLGIEPGAIINEYSMTELSSQFYTRGIDQPHAGPIWTRIRVIDPLTETDALPGMPGHLVIYDLANLHSVMAIRTQDLAISTPAEAAKVADGVNSFTLLGRDPSALPRGCSRAADDTLQS